MQCELILRAYFQTRIQIFSTSTAVAGKKRNKENAKRKNKKDAT